MRHRYRNKQQGVVLVIALIALVAISLAGVALMRSVDTSNVVSGNIAFNETAIQMADVGAEQAYTEILGNLTSNPSSCQFIQANCPNNSAGQFYFYPNISSLNVATKLPNITPLNWSDPLAVTLPGDTAASYSIQYIIERMCGNVVTGSTATPGDNTANSQETATFAKCRAAPLYDSNGNPSIGTGKLFYRITVQVTGPRNTRGLAQYFYGVQDTVN